MNRLRTLFIICSTIIVVVVISGCRQAIFVGLPKQEIIIYDSELGPIPPLGPISFARDKGVDDIQLLADTGARPLLEAPDGPAFAWSETENILILGTDRRENADNWRTDTIMVVGIDRQRQRAAVLSIPRDLYLQIPDYGYGRINQVDYIGERVLKVPGGGPAMVSTILSQTLGISTKHWVRFEMTGFQSVVDAIGGVTIYLDCPFYEPIFNLTTNSWDYFTLPAGEVHLDGEAAYWYVRLRLRESDIGRSNRQRQFLWAVREQMLNGNLLVRLPELWTAFRHSFTTDLNLLQIIELARFGIDLDPSNVRASGITLRELQSQTTAQGASVLVINDPAQVRAVVEGIWAAPAMVDTNRKDVEKCSTTPYGAPSVATETSVPAPLPDPVAAPAEVGQPVNDTNAANEQAIPAADEPLVVPLGETPGEDGVAAEPVEIAPLFDDAAVEPEAPLQAHDGG